MNGNRRSGLIPPLFLLSLAACLPFSGCLLGGTSETTSGDLHTGGEANNAGGLRVSVQYADGAPAAKVGYRIVESTDWLGLIGEGKSAILDSGWTDGNGRAQLQVPSGRLCNLEIDADAEGLFLNDVRAQWGDSGSRTLTLQAYGSLCGAILRTGGQVAEVRLKGSGYLSTVDAGPAYGFDRVAPGTYTLVTLEVINGILTPAVHQSVVVAPGANMLGADIDSVRVDGLPPVLIAPTAIEVQ